VTTAITSATASAARPGRGRRGVEMSTSSTGATTRSPMRSPTHQARHARPISAADTMPPA
jgi:hypothetical protein